MMLRNLQRARTGIINFTGEGINAGDIVNVKITRAQNFTNRWII